MNDQSKTFDGERRQTDALAPENTNREQVDEPGQSQTVAEQALERSVSVLGQEDTEKVQSVFDAHDASDVIDKMNEMERTGQIDLSAYAGEPNHDDEPGTYRSSNSIGSGGSVGQAGS